MKPVHYTLRLQVLTQESLFKVHSQHGYGAFYLVRRFIYWGYSQKELVHIGQVQGDDHGRIMKITTSRNKSEVKFTLPIRYIMATLDDVRTMF